MINDPTTTKLVDDLVVGDVIVKDVDFHGRTYIESSITEVVATDYVHPHVEGMTWSIFVTDDSGNRVLPSTGRMMLPNGTTCSVLTNPPRKA